MLYKAVVITFSWKTFKNLNYVLIYTKIKKSKTFKFILYLFTSRQQFLFLLSF